jgi:demethylmenaquinone methyltransferase/2-methoxy-6-polyprenyl-1,4-benzoquinol methylase
MNASDGTQFEGKEDYIKDVFTEIADYYDDMNNIMTMNMIKGWHSFMMKKAGDLEGKRCLDVGTGTGEIAFQLAGRAGKDGDVTGVDITPRMLELAEKKMGSRKLPKDVRFIAGDALALDFDEGSFDIVTSGYMLRNVTDIQRAIDEMHRVLRPGGKVIVAELAKPGNRVIRRLYEFFIKHHVLRYGRMYDRGESIDGRMPAYDWLTSSVEGFPSGKEMATKFEKAGFRDVTYHSKSFGAVNIYVGCK